MDKIISVSCETCIKDEKYIKCYVNFEKVNLKKV